MARTPASRTGPLLLGCALLAGPYAAAAQDAASEPAAPALPAPTDTVLPRSGIDPTVSDLREHLLDSFGESAPVQRPAGPALQITGQFGLAEEFTDNVGATAGTRNGSGGGDAITRLSPGIDIQDTTERLHVSLDYQPVGEIYASNGNYSQFEQQFTGDVLATALPGWLYADARGAVSQQAVYGGFGPAATATLAPGNRETVSSASFSPYVSHQFGTTGTLQIGAGYIYSATDAPTPPPGTATLFGTGAYGSSYLATKRGFASFETGEDLGRLRDRIGTDDEFYDGSGALAGGHRVLVTDDTSYALSRLVTLLGQLGWEDLSYPRSLFAYRGPVGAGGVKLTPAPHSSLVVEYRDVDGLGSAFVQGSVQVTARVRVFGGYSSGISTEQQDVQTALLDAGSETDTASGLAGSVLQASPLLGGGDAFGANQNLNRTHRLDVSAAFLGNRDTATLSVQYETTDPVGRPVGQFAAVSTRGIFGNVSVTHDLSPVLSLTGFLQYGSNRTGLARAGQGDDNGQTLSVSAAVNWTFTRTVSAYAQFSGTYPVGGSAFAASGYQGLDGGQTTVTLGAVKRF